KEHVIAIRFAAWTGASWLQAFSRTPLLSVTMYDMPQFLQERSIINHIISSFAVLFSVFLLLCFLHGAYYRYKPEMRANQYFAVYTSLMAFGFFCLWLWLTVQDVRINTYVNSLA